ncbi:hypothetical protein [Paraburkholderia sp. WSM4175]
MLRLAPPNATDAQFRQQRIEQHENVSRSWDAWQRRYDQGAERALWERA